MLAGCEGDFPSWKHKQEGQVVSQGKGFRVFLALLLEVIKAVWSKPNLGREPLASLMPHPAHLLVTEEFDDATSPGRLCE